MLGYANLRRSRIPLYPMSCRSCGHSLEIVVPVAEAPSGASACPECSAIELRQDYVAKMPQVGAIDGETTGFYPASWGFPSAHDPKHPTLKVAPPKHGWKEHIKRSEGTIGDVS